MPVVNLRDRQKRQAKREAKWQTYWRAPRLWPNATVYILGGGPSLKLLDVERLRGRHVIAVNNAYQLGDWIDVCYFGDLSWHRIHRDALLKFAGLKVTTCVHLENAPGIKLIRKRNKPSGISRDQSIVCWNNSSGGCAINLATLFGAKRIILFGYDMRMVDDDCNWHRDYPDVQDEKKRKKKEKLYLTFLKPFDQIARGLKRDGIECINATPGSALTQFPIVEPESVL